MNENDPKQLQDRSKKYNFLVPPESFKVFVKNRERKSICDTITQKSKEPSHFCNSNDSIAQDLLQANEIGSQTQYDSKSCHINTSQENQISKALKLASSIYNPNNPHSGSPQSENATSFFEPPSNNPGEEEQQMSEREGEIWQDFGKVGEGRRSGGGGNYKKDPVNVGMGEIDGNGIKEDQELLFANFDPRSDPVLDNYDSLGMAYKLPSRLLLRNQKKEYLKYVRTLRRENDKRLK